MTCYCCLIFNAYLLKHLHAACHNALWELVCQRKYQYIVFYCFYSCIVINILLTNAIEIQPL